LIRADDNDLFLLCCIGSRIGALALRDVRETMRPLPVEPLAGAPPFVLGLATIRGFPTPVVDVGRLLGSSDPSCRPALCASLARYVSLELGERTAALAVDAVLGVRPVPSGVLINIPPLLQEACASVVSVVGALDARLLLVLETARLVPDSAWSAIEVPGVAA
jgi:purine-binding chemotaxis protein CheW